MNIESNFDDIYIDLEIEQQDVYVDIGLEKSDIVLTEQEAEILRGAQGEQIHELSLWFEFGVADWEEIATNSYRLVVSRETHAFNSPFIAEMLLIDEDGAENNLRPTYRVSANDSVVIFSDEAVNCKIKIGGEK